MANQLVWGFHSLKDLAAKRVTEVGVSVIDEAIRQAVSEHNRQMDAARGLFVKRTTDFKVKFKSNASQRLQPLDQDGRARPIQAGSLYETAFPIQQAGTAWGANRVARAKMTVQDVNDTISDILMADLRWNRDHIFAALFTNVTWTFPDDEHGDLTIQPLANADTVTYQIQTGADAGATDTHFLAQASAIDNSNDPFPTIYTELKEHPENGGEVVSLIPTNLKATVEALSGFYPISDPRIRLGSGQAELVGELGVNVPGKIIGYHDSGVWIAEWMSHVSSYITSVTTEGERPIAMREHAEAELQGFGEVAIRADHPFWESQWERHAGFGAWNRVGAVITRIGNASYAIPTGYSSPMG
jgi:hypothetical protein